METITIDILNPKATKLLRNLEELKLISIHEKREREFATFLTKLRSNLPEDKISLEDITKEVEIVRSKRYAK